MREMHPDDQAKLGRILGMKPSEIVAAAEIPDSDPAALVVQTLDGKRVRLTSENNVTFEVSPWDGDMPGSVEADGLDGDEGDVEGVDDGLEGGKGGGEQVPDGNADVVLAWVGDDKDRAAQALVAEQAGKKRSTLIGQLEKVAQA